MRSRRGVPVVDVIFAGLVGLASWFSAQASRGQPELVGPPVGRDAGPMWDPGPPSPPPHWAAEDVIWWQPAPFVLVTIAALVVRRRWPRIAFFATVVAVAGFLAIGAPYGPVLLAPALAVHAMALTLPVRQWAPWTVLLVPMLMSGFWSEPWLGFLDPRAYAALVFGVTLIMLPAMVGLLWRNRRENERAQREQELRRHGYEERLRIAREVHDVVGHSLSVINMQAGVALHVLDRRPEQIAASLEAIKQTSKEALAELRSTLEVFRDPAGRAPPPGLERVGDLVRTLRTAGRTVELTDERPAGPRVPAAVDQAAFRIVQEALTNVVRHTGSEVTAHVTITTSTDQLVVTVTDDGSGAPAVLVEGSGITGMRERARSVGGTLDVRPAQGSGVWMRAVLPLAAEPVP